MQKIREDSPPPEAQIFEALRPQNVPELPLALAANAQFSKPVVQMHSVPEIDQN